MWDYRRCDGRQRGGQGACGARDEEVMSVNSPKSKAAPFMYLAASMPHTPPSFSTSHQRESRLMASAFVTNAWIGGGGGGTG